MPVVAGTSSLPGWPARLPAGFGSNLDAFAGFAPLAFGLPPQPADPKARAVWREMVADLTSVMRPPPPSIGPPDPAVERMRNALSAMGVGMHDMRRAAVDDAGDEATDPRTAGGSRIGSSRNWSGAVILPRHGKRFAQVVARWTLPRIRRGVGREPFVCSQWIGVDGLRRWMTSMPQMGTAQHLGQLVKGEPSEGHFAWRQWWLRGGGKTHTPKPLGPPLAPGKTVYCCMSLLPPDQPRSGSEHLVHFFLRVLGDPIAYTDVDSPPTMPNGREGRATGASAQWIVERPTALKPSPSGAVKEGDNYPLPDFGECSADRFAAVLAESPAAIDLADPAADPEDERRVALRTPRKLRMIERFDNPSRIEVIAKPTEAKGDRITVRYVRR